MSQFSPCLITHTTHNIGEDAELVDGPEEVQPDNLDDTPSMIWTQLRIMIPLPMIWT